MFFCADSNVPDRLRAARGLSSPYNFVYGGSWRGRGRCPPCSSPGMRTGKEDKVNILGICAADLLNTLEYNLTREGDDSRFQRAVVYHRLPESIAREFESISKETSYCQTVLHCNSIRRINTDTPKHRSNHEYSSLEHRRVTRH